ncbi:MAG: glycosyltransferase family 4 protein [Acidobacteriota bacterium]
MHFESRSSKPEAALRVAFIAGTLGQGGTERQLLYMVRSLQEAGCLVQVCCLTRGEANEAELRKNGIEAIWVGRHGNPPARVVEIVKALRPFQPHVVQSMHSFANLYAALPALALGAISAGSLRCDLKLSARENGRWAKWLLRVPDGLVVNSKMLHGQVTHANVLTPDRLYYLANRVDLDFFGAPRLNRHVPVALFIGRLIREKRLDRFLQALAIARNNCTLRAIVAGDGPERQAMETLALNLGIAEHVEFLGSRDDIPNLLAQSDMLALTSDSEGSANVILEAMAGRLPVITTPAGDAATTVTSGVTGFVVPFEDTEALARRMVDLANSAELRVQMGKAGRASAESQFGLKGLSEDMYAIYVDIGRRKQNRRLLDLSKSKEAAVPCVKP